MIELKPCPHCGENVRWCGIGNKDPKDDHNCQQIHCDNCGVQFDVDSYDANSSETLAEARKVVAKIWNSRS